jgi:hypothetical protein
MVRRAERPSIATRVGCPTHSEITESAGAVTTVLLAPSGIRATSSRCMPNNADLKSDPLGRYEESAGERAPSAGLRIPHLALCPVGQDSGLEEFSGESAVASHG